RRHTRSKRDWSSDVCSSDLRRTYDLAGKIPVLEHRGAILNLYDTTLTYEGKKIDLTKNEFRILQTLMENKGRLVSRDTLMTKLRSEERRVGKEGRNRCGRKK